jgi:hypothetical protein
MGRRQYAFAKAEADTPKQHGGNAYYAIQTTEAFYADFVADYGQTYTDHSYSIHNTIQSAIDACTANRGDIVYVVGEWTVTAVAATQINLNKWGTTLKGLTDWENMTGGGNANITCAEADVATITVSKAKCHIENLVIYFNGTGDTFGINFASAAPSQAVVRNVEIVKNGGTASDKGIGMHFATVPTRSLFENIKITGPTSNSKTMAYGIEGGSYSCVYKNIQVSNATVGINLDTYGDLFDHIIIMPTCTTGLVLTGDTATQSLVVDSHDAAVSAGSITAATSGSYTTSLTTLT